jgi:hypothetical protein
MIMCELKPFEKPQDRPDLCVRVFRLKFGFLMEDLLKKHVLGKVIAQINVIEFQKRGLPHAHILLILHVCFIINVGFKIRRLRV